MITHNGHTFPRPQRSGKWLIGAMWSDSSTVMFPYMRGQLGDAAFYTQLCKDRYQNTFGREPVCIIKIKLK